MHHRLPWRSVAQALGHISTRRAVISYKHFLTSNLQIVRTYSSCFAFYLVDNSDRECSESPRKSMVGDRNDGSRKWKSPGSCSTSTNSAVYCRYSVISQALQQVLHTYTLNDTETVTTIQEKNKK